MVGQLCGKLSTPFYDVFRIYVGRRDVNLGDNKTRPQKLSLAAGRPSGYRRADRSEDLTANSTCLARRRFDGQLYLPCATRILHNTPNMSTSQYHVSQREG
jgi:hypothetical protein